MGAYWNTPRREKGYGFSHSLSAFQLHARSVAFLHYTRRAFERLRWRGFIAAKWNIDEDEAMIAPPHHGSTMIAHHVQCNRHGGGQAIDHLPKTIANQQEIAVRTKQFRQNGSASGRERVGKTGKI